MSELWICKKCTITGTDLGEWDSSSTFFPRVRAVHHTHSGFQKGRLVKEVSEIGKQVDVLLEQAFHDIICHLKGCTKVQQIKDKPWWEMSNWTH